MREEEVFEAICRLSFRDKMRVLLEVIHQRIRMGVSSMRDTHWLSLIEYMFCMDDHIAKAA